MICPECGSSNIIEWNTVDVMLDVDGEEPDGTLVYGTWKAILEGNPGHHRDMLRS